MDFHSALETFAEAWVAANTGKLGSVVNALSTAGPSAVDLNKAAESIMLQQQQLGKGIVGVSAPVFPTQLPTTENGGLDYPKIHSRSITPLSAQLPVGGVGGMDLSPSSKRIKEFSTTPDTGGNTSAENALSGRKTSRNSLPEFDHVGFFLQHGNPQNTTTSTSSQASAATALLVEGINQTTESRKKLVANKKTPKKGEDKENKGICTPPSPKRRRAPRPRNPELSNPESVLSDVLDTVASFSDASAAASPEVESLVESMIEAYQKSKEGKSLPIHCVIEVNDKDGMGDPNSKFSSGESSRGRDKSQGKGETEGSGTGSPLSRGGGKIIEVDDFVIIPAGTAFQDVVTTVLNLLGYPKDVVQQAEGTIILKNWKPLKLEQVCDSPHTTVGDILTDLTNHATLRILVTRPKGGATEDLKEKLLRLLLAQSSNILLGSGCPLDEGTLSQLVKGQWPQNLAEDVKRRFDQWYSTHQQKLAAAGLEAHLPVIGHNHPSSSSSLGGGNNGNNGSPTNLSVTSSAHNHLVNGSCMTPTVRHHLLDKSPYEEDNTSHPVFHKTRARTSFDQEMELPRLQQWFAENPHPSRHQIQQYVRELNTLDCRKDRKPLDLNNVIYWFKNARAAQKRNELRYNGYSPSQSFPHHLNAQAIGGNHLNSDGRPNGHMSDDRLRDERNFMNENSGSSCRDSSDDMEPDMKKERETNDNNHNSDNRVEEENQKMEVEDQGAEEIRMAIKQEHEEDFISVDVELSEGTGGNLRPPIPGAEESSNNNEPKDLSGKPQQQSSEECKTRKNDEGNEDKKQLNPVSRTHHHSQMEQQEDGQGSNSSSPTVSPRSSPGLSPTHPYDFSGAPSMVSRFHPFFEHPFMAYRHFNSFNFGQTFPGSNGPNVHEASAYEAALGLVNRKGVTPSGKGAPGMEGFHEYQNGMPMIPSRGPSGADHNLARMRSEDLFPSRPASSAELISSIINSNQLNLGNHHQGPNSMSMDERRTKRNRTFIDPVTEVPLLEKWFTLNTHPSHNLILKYTEELNRMPYRAKFPKLEPKNVQFWFKNRRAKTKRLKMSM